MLLPELLLSSLFDESKLLCNKLVIGQEKKRQKFAIPDIGQAVPRLYIYYARTTRNFQKNERGAFAVSM